MTLAQKSSLPTPPERLLEILRGRGGGGLKAIMKAFKGKNKKNKSLTGLSRGWRDLHVKSIYLPSERRVHEWI